SRRCVRRSRLRAMRSPASSSIRKPSTGSWPTIVRATTRWRRRTVGRRGSIGSNHTAWCKHMEYRQLGHSGLKVSAVGLGCNNFGRRCSVEETQTVVHKALDLGITMFDTADFYSAGLSEEYLGKALGPRRKDIVLATKFGLPMGKGEYSGGG